MVFHRKLLTVIKKLFTPSEPLSRITSINLHDGITAIHCYGMNDITTLTFDEMINDVAMLSNLSPTQAAFFGYFYGKHHSQQILIKEKAPLKTATDFLLHTTKARYHLLSQNRQGDFVFYDNKKQITLTQAPQAMLNNKHLMIGFGSMQACYIGIIAGIAAWKTKSPALQETFVKTPLRLVK